MSRVTFVSGTSGSRFVPLEPTRLVDTRYKVPFAGPIITHTPVTVAIAGRGGIPSSATGISGNPDRYGPDVCGLPHGRPAPHRWIAAGLLDAQFPKGRQSSQRFRRESVSNGSIGVTYEASRAGSTTNFVLDVTGYFLPSP